MVCGIPIVEYDHMEPFADVQVHEEENLTCLCPLHHREKTNGTLPIENVRRSNSKPYNIGRGITAPYGLHFNAGPIEFQLGNVIFRTSAESGVFVPIMVDDLALLGFQEIDDEFGLWASDFDEYNYPTLQIEHNILRVGLNSWDATFISNRLIVRSGPGQVKLAVQFEPPSRVVILRAQFKYNGVTVDVRSNRMTVNGFQFSGMAIEAPEVGIRVGPQIDQPPTDSIYLRANRYKPDEPAQMLFGGRDPGMQRWYERSGDPQPPPPTQAASPHTTS